MPLGHKNHIAQLAELWVQMVEIPQTYSDMETSLLELNGATFMFQTKFCPVLDLIPKCQAEMVDLLLSHLTNL